MLPSLHPNQGALDLYAMAGRGRLHAGKLPLLPEQLHQSHFAKCLCYRALKRFRVVRWPGHLMRRCIPLQACMSIVPAGSRASILRKSVLVRHPHLSVLALLACPRWIGTKDAQEWRNLFQMPQGILNLLVRQRANEVDVKQVVVPAACRSIPCNSTLGPELASARSIGRGSAYRFRYPALRVTGCFSSAGTRSWSCRCREAQRRSRL